MKDWDFVDWLFAAGFALLAIAMVLIVIIGGTYSVKSARTHAFCLQEGYAEYDVTWNFDAYCVQRDYRGTMHPIPISELE
jgi:hypothetical protein